MHCDACCGWDGESRYLETWSPARGTRSGREQSVLSRCTWPRWCSSPGDWPRGTEPVSEVLRDDESDELSDCGWSCEDRCFSGETVEQVFYIDLELKKKYLELNHRRITPGVEVPFVRQQSSRSSIFTLLESLQKWIFLWNSWLSWIFLFLL